MSEIEFDRDHFIMVEWPEALVSGEFKQGYGSLNRDDRFCCLGVACELLVRKGLLSRHGNGVVQYGAEGVFSDTILPYEAGRPLGISFNGAYEDEITGDIEYLTEKNDKGFSFAEIANSIKLAHGSGGWLRH